MGSNGKDPFRTLRKSHHHLPLSSPASSCSALPPDARLGPLQSPLGLNQTANLASIARDADFFIPRSRSSLNPRHPGLAQGAPHLYLIN